MVDRPLEVERVESKGQSRAVNIHTYIRKLRQWACHLQLQSLPRNSNKYNKNHLQRLREERIQNVLNSHNGGGLAVENQVIIYFLIQSSKLRNRCIKL